MTPEEEKKVLRHEMKHQRARLDSQQKVTYSLHICENLKKNMEVRAAHIIAAYHPFPNEVNLKPLYTYLEAQGKILAFPVWQKNSHNMDFYSSDTLIDPVRCERQ